MVEQNNIPFRDKPVKTAYMWRDMERRAAMHGLPIAVPAPYPLPQLPFANQVARPGLREGWGEAYIRETYRRWFVDGQRPGEDPNLSDSLAAVGVDPDGTMARARAPEAQPNAVEIPRRLRLPQFRRADGELFWGDDRLEAALDWATGRQRL
jgi:2-hydroxychromene-2-carboxylate isomerase